MRVFLCRLPPSASTKLKRTHVLYLQTFEKNATGDFPGKELKHWAHLIHQYIGKITIRDSLLIAKGSLCDAFAHYVIAVCPRAEAAMCTIEGKMGSERSWGKWIHGATLYCVIRQTVFMGWQQTQWKCERSQRHLQKTRPDDTRQTRRRLGSYICMISCFARPPSVSRKGCVQRHLSARRPRVNRWKVLSIWVRWQFMVTMWLFF